MFLTAFSVVQLFNGKKYAHENETVELDHTRLMDLGEQYLNKGDVERAVSCFKKSAEFGNAKAQRWLGACYYFGTGIREDKQEAVKWYRLAADQGTRKPSGGWETVIFGEKESGGQAGGGEVVPSGSRTGGTRKPRKNW